MLNLYSDNLWFFIAIDFEAEKYIDIDMIYYVHELYKLVLVRYVSLHQCIYGSYGNVDGTVKI